MLNQAPRLESGPNWIGKGTGYRKFDRRFARGTIQRAITDFEHVGLSISRARHLVRDIPYFEELERMMPGFCERTAHLVEFISVPKGTVVFREGDPALCLYYIVSGEVEVCVRENDPPRTPQYDKNKKPQKTLANTFFERVGLRKVDPIRKKLEEQDRKSEFLYTRHETLEAFNTYAEASNLGKIDGILGPTSCFGEMALKNNDPRNATIKCLQDCEFMRIHRDSFDVQMADKMTFFQSNVPGFGNIRILDAKDHPANFFAVRHYERGRILLREGTVEDPSIFVIRQGTVTFQRRVRSRLPIGTNHGKNYRYWQVMKDGEMFSSLAMLGFDNGEPCTAVVTSDESTIFHLTGKSMSDLEKFPKEILLAFTEHIRQEMKPLLRLSDAFRSVEALPCNEGWNHLRPVTPLIRPISRQLSKSFRGRKQKNRVAPSGKINTTGTIRIVVQPRGWASE